MHMRAILGMLLLVSSAAIHAQSAATPGFAFDQRISDCEARWFAAQTQGGKVNLGFLYIDPQAGFTIEHYGNLEREGTQLVAVKSELHGKARMIQRVGSNFAASCLGDETVASLGLPPEPESMQFYRDERPPGEHHASWAYHYNHIGASDVALTHVAKARAAGYSSPALTFEHAFALNATGQFDQVVVLLTPVAKARDALPDTVAELAYAHLMQGEYEQAIGHYKRALDGKGVKSTERRWQFAQNIARAYERLGDTELRDKWLRTADAYRQGTE